MEFTFRTPTKMSMTQMLPSSGSTSPFTPKKSRVKIKSNEDFGHVPSILEFDDSNSVMTFNRKLEFSSPKQQSLLFNENESIYHEQTTPLKTQQSVEDQYNTILLSPSIKNYPKRFNINTKKDSVIEPSSKTTRSNNSTPSKRFKTNAIQNCKSITDYFKPCQKSVNFINNVDNKFQTVDHKLNIENMSVKRKICIESEFSTDNTENSKIVTNCNKLLLTKSPSQNLNVVSVKNNSTKKNSIANQVTPKKKKSRIVINNQSSKDNSVILSIQKENSKSPKNQGIESSQKNNIQPLNHADIISPCKNGPIDNSLKSPRIINYLTNKLNISGGDTYSKFIKFIVLRPEIFFFGRSNIMTIIENSTNDELKIFGRLMNRKHGWIRLNGSSGLQNYKNLNLCCDFDNVLKSLATKQLITTDVISCELDDMLNILKASELKELQKTFNINNNQTKTKPEMIRSFIKFVKNQRTFCGNSVYNLKERVKKEIGYCLKLSDQSRDDIMSCTIYESYPYFKGEEKDRFHESFNIFSLVKKNELKFPKYEIMRKSVNFNSKESFDMYKDALNLCGEIQLSLEQKDYENAITVLNIVFDKFKIAVLDQSNIDSLSNIPTYLRKFSAVSLYAYTLFKNITILKKSKENKNLAKEVLEFLLKHNQFLLSKRADLHIELAKVLESQYKQLDLAVKIILDGLKDNTMSELDRQMLSTRALLYANRKVRKLDDQLKKELLSLIVTTECELPSIRINGQIVTTQKKESSGRKQVYSKKNENGDLLYMSVEELAISHYKSLGFLYGIHDEGQLIKSMFLLCFWDIIYGSFPPYVLFIREFQDCPLDWRTRHFYKIREKEINERMIEIKQMNVDQICDMLKVRCEEFYGIQSVINWNFMNIDNLLQCKTLLECVGVDLFLAIGDQILKDGRIYLHGMPDLIVWNAVNHKCKFVEVKGPNDKLSERQYSWLHKLIKFGANVEVCHVVGTGGKTNNCEHID